MADKFAIITGASTGIGFELATLAAKDGYDILVVANEALIQAAAADFKQFGTEVTAVEANLSTIEGVDALLAATNGRKVDVLCANAGQGLGHGTPQPGDGPHPCGDPAAGRDRPSALPRSTQSSIRAGIPFYPHTSPANPVLPAEFHTDRRRSAYGPGPRQRRIRYGTTQSSIRPRAEFDTRKGLNLRGDHANSPSHITC